MVMNCGLLASKNTKNYNEVKSLNPGGQFTPPVRILNLHHDGCVIRKLHPTGTCHRCPHWLIWSQGKW
ncbi:unnamed protein product [Acanthoscelides obtectus]|uniref:Uncharacterized protein n=1 Tax=Acanthoscelides obtectus TaxID=200917 RepID=A0A9P0PB76_ACAOB|nr:unnamed protein product [Acanthoscelides obtectus]CAK1660599.1 hypothetical protein AOBTE_LOCUS22168 [Acanthoscelides obtectus]